MSGNGNNTFDSKTIPSPDHSEKHKATDNAAHDVKPEPTNKIHDTAEKSGSSEKEGANAPHGQQQSGWKVEVIDGPGSSDASTSNEAATPIGIMTRIGDGGGARDIEQAFDQMFAAMGTSEEEIIADAMARFEEREQERKAEELESKGKREEHKS